MIISTKKKFIFIHNPKTGGVSVNNVLQPYGNFFSRLQENKFFSKLNKMGLKRLIGDVYTVHTPAWRVEKYYPKLWQEYYTFGFVRNPYNRAYSYYQFLTKHANEPWAAHAREISFEDYVMQIKNEPWIDYQYYYFCQQNTTKLMIDGVYKMEELNSAMQVLSEKLNLELVQTIPHLNATQKKNDYMDQYTSKMIGEINTIFTKDFELFGYDKQ